MPATPTRPRLEQIRFTSSKTGTHNIDTYLESAEIGNRTLASLLADLFDENSNGDFRSDIFDFRSNDGLLQFRVGTYLDPEAGWQDVDFRTITGKPAVTFPMSTEYPSQSMFLLGSKLYISNTAIQYSTQAAFDAGVTAGDVIEIFDANNLSTAALDQAVLDAQAARDDAEDATINNADFNALVARLTDIQNLANPAANRTALEAFGDSYTANPSSNAITGLNNIGNTATAVTGLTNLKDSATALANLANSAAAIDLLGDTQNIVDAIELLGDNQTRVDAIDALGDTTTAAAIDRLNQTDSSSTNNPQDTTADYIDALGTSAMVAKLVALHAIITEINALASRTTAIDALNQRTTEIDALYAIRADIDAIGDTTTLNDISTVAGISTTHVASIDQDLGTTDSPTFNAITVDTIDPDPNNAGTPLTIAGDLIVSGTTTTVSSNTVNIGDSIITLNSDETGVPSQDAGFEVERGTSTNVSFVWDETYDRFTTNGEDLAASTFIGPLTGDVTGNADTATTWATPRTVQLQGDVTGTASNVDGSANITINTSMAANSVDLGTHTVGNYVGAGATSGNGISGSINAAGGTFTVTSNATNANTPSTIVFRDASGDFAAGTITTDEDAVINGVNIGTGPGTGLDNTRVGEDALSSLTTGPQNVAVGAYSLQDLTTGANNVAVGWSALEHQTIGNSNVAIGREALRWTGETTGNIGIGSLALRGPNDLNVLTGDFNVGIGNQALQRLTSGDENIAIGRFNSYSMSTGAANVSVGSWALYNETTGYYNAVFGHRAMEYTNAAAGNVAIGYYALRGSSGAYVTGDLNTAVGRSAGESLTTGSQNIIIGYNADAFTPTTSHEITLGDDTDKSFRIPGSSFYINGGSEGTTGTKVGINTSSPAAQLHVNGDTQVDGTITADDLTLSDATPTLTLEDTDGTDVEGLVFQTGETLTLRSQNGANYGKIQLQTRTNQQSSTVNALTVNPNRQIQFDQYGSGNFQGTNPTRALAVDGSGNIVEMALGTSATGGSYDSSNGTASFTFSDSNLNFSTTDLRGATGATGATGSGFTGGSYNTSTGIVTFTSNDGLGFSTSDLRGATGASGANGDGFTGGSYNSSNGIVTFTSDDGLGFSTGDLRGADGANGTGFTGGSYNSTTGIVTFTSSDGLGFSTTDLRGADGSDGTDGTNGTNGANGDGFTGGSYNSTTGIVTFTSDDGLGFSTTDLRGADGTDGTNGTGFTGGSYNASNGIVTFTSNDGLGFSTGDLRGADGSDATVTTAAVQSAGALMDTQLVNLAAVKAINQGLTTTSAPEFADLTLSDATPTLTLEDTDGTDRVGLVFQATQALTLRSRAGTANGEIALQLNDGTATSQVLTCKSNKQIQLDQYGAGNFSSTSPQYSLAVDASGNIIEQSIKQDAITTSTALAAASLTTVTDAGNTVDVRRADRIAQGSSVNVDGGATLYDVTATAELRLNDLVAGDIVTVFSRSGTTTIARGTITYAFIDGDIATNKTTVTVGSGTLATVTMVSNDTAIIAGSDLT